MNQMQQPERRMAFEAWISSSPYERSIERWPDDAERYAWHGQYQDDTVALAWDAWEQAAATRGLGESPPADETWDAWRQMVERSRALDAVQRLVGDDPALRVKFINKLRDVVSRRKKHPSDLDLVFAKKEDIEEAHHAIAPVK